MLTMYTLSIFSVSYMVLDLKYNPNICKPSIDIFNQLYNSLIPFTAEMKKILKQITKYSYSLYK